MKTIEKFIVAEGRRVRFTNFVDRISLDFELNAKSVLPEAALVQQLTYASHVESECYVMQVTASDGKPALQVITYVARPKIFPWFGMATVPSFSQARNGDEEAFGLKILGELMRAVPGIMCLRVQSKRFESEKLSTFMGNAEKANYFLSAPLAPVRTLMLELGETIESLQVRLSQKTRQKLRHAIPEQFSILEMTSSEHIEVCDLAMNKARARTGGGLTTYNFKTAFAVAKNHPDRAKVLGLFLKSEPKSLLAYVIGYRSGVRAEYASAGSLASPELRQIPYNYFLLWELMNWARASGATIMDLGGVSHGGESDPLKGISRFKRSFPAEEIEVGREMVKLIRPSLFAIYSTLKNITSGFRWKNPVQSKVALS